MEVTKAQLDKKLNDAERLLNFYEIAITKHQSTIEAFKIGIGRSVVLEDRKYLALLQGDLKILHADRGKVREEISELQNKIRTHSSLAIEKNCVAESDEAGVSEKSDAAAEHSLKPQPESHTKGESESGTVEQEVSSSEKTTIETLGRETATGGPPETTTTEPEISGSDNTKAAPPAESVEGPTSAAEADHPLFLPELTTPDIFLNQDAAAIIDQLDSDNDIF